MSTIRQASAHIRQIAKNVDANAKLVVRKAALAIDQALVLSTPVDTGRARANWQVNVGAPASGDVETFPPSMGSDAIGVIGASGEFAMTAAIEGTKDFQGGVIYIVNNLPYITPLNEGHSKQAPSGFVQNAIIAGLNAVEDVKFTETPKGYGEKK
jgi:hypothetical protein